MVCNHKYIIFTLLCNVPNRRLDTCNYLYSNCISNLNSVGIINMGSNNTFIMKRVERILLAMCNDGFLIATAVVLWAVFLIKMSIHGHVGFFSTYTLFSISFYYVTAISLMLPNEIEGRCILAVLRRCIISRDHRILFRSYKYKILPMTIILFGVASINLIVILCL